MSRRGRVREILQADPVHDMAPFPTMTTDEQASDDYADLGEKNIGSAGLSGRRRPSPPVPVLLDTQSEQQVNGRSISRIERGVQSDECVKSAPLDKMDVLDKPVQVDSTAGATHTDTLGLAFTTAVPVQPSPGPSLSPSSPRQTRSPDNPLSPLIQRPAGTASPSPVLQVTYTSAERISSPTVSPASPISSRSGGLLDSWRSRERALKKGMSAAEAAERGDRVWSGSMGAVSSPISQGSSFGLFRGTPPQSKQEITSSRDKEEDEFGDEDGLDFRDMLRSGPPAGKGK